ncbi:MAG: hypothetical protein DMD78_09100 [Candidatus Rokuibacteriota bacterium]|nr:MAG: hypothetical protein DMD78_09100 [Candidatus Rokubacteria bacterium]
MDRIMQRLHVEEMMMKAITTTLLLVAGLAAGCATPSYHGPGPSTTTYYTAPAATYVYTPSDRASCEAVGGRWHTFSGTCTFPR